MSEWIPVLYRGDGAWIGVMPNGRIGVGIESEGRASLVGSGFVPMWPYMERDLMSSLAEFESVWAQLERGGVSTPERLLELTVESAWSSRRSYWVELAALWVIEMRRQGGFDEDLVAGLIDEVASSSTMPVEIQDQARLIK